ncbi:lysine transporter LysE [Trinickia symbiotica]|uniref:Lysine transporter LysE n=1 Tax=Trinickia symbiotica TaxID=863227 RepID=A0A2T3XXY7_9BURK|nr:LysE family translocator [Trinickia symbiotica]PTB21364.1 lysine transporter LysE [Trinickia symbiotica]
MTIDKMFAFGLTCLGFGFIPGPALLQTVSLTLQHGRRAGLLSALGIHVGAFFQICLVAFGAVVVLQTTPWLYHALRIVGGAYLVWLGIERLRTKPAHNVRTGLPTRIVFSSAFIEASNPKSALFYMSFLLQFADPTASINVGWQLFLLGAAANAFFTIADLVCIVLAHPLRRNVSSEGAALTLGRYLSGALFIALGVVAIVDR